MASTAAPSMISSDNGVVISPAGEEIPTEARPVCRRRYAVKEIRIPRSWFLL